MDPFANRSDKAFAAQFEPDGDSFLFYADNAGAPVRVTITERDAAIKAYKDSFYGWGLVTSMAFAICFVFAVYLPSNLSGKVQLIAILGFVVTSNLFWARAYRAPARQFSNRAPEGPPRSKAEVRTIKDRQITWFNIAGMAVAGAILTMLLINSPLTRETQLTLLIGPLFLAAFPYGIWRKFRSA